MDTKVLYILGSSYSSSTLLGSLLGMSESTQNVGELKFYNRHSKFRDQNCSCGEAIPSCPFWNKINEDDYNIYEVPSAIQKLVILFKILFSLSFQQIGRKTDDVRLFNKIRNVFIETKSTDDNPLIIDVSKSLWRLIYLKQNTSLNVKVLYLKRDIFGNVNSFMKHGYLFWEGVLIYVLNHLFIKLYLKNFDIEFEYLDYLDFCKSPNSHIEDISNTLGIEPPEFPSTRIVHVPSGNQNTLGSISSGDFQIKYDKSWSRQLTKFQQIVLLILSRIT